MAVQTQIQVRRGTASSWTSTNPTLAAGELGFETDTGKFKIGTGSATWTALSYAGGGQNTLTTYQYTATSGQTTFSGTDANGNTLSYTAGAVQVYLNGALLVNTTDYAATNGTSVVLTTGATVGDSLTILSLGSFTVSTDIPKSTLSAKGSLISATAASTPSEVTVGTDGYYLTADSTQASGIKWAAAPSSGGMTLITETTASALSSLSFTGLGSYKHLWLTWDGVQTSNDSTEFGIRLNNDSTSIYTNNRWGAANSTFGTNNNASADNIGSNWVGFAVRSSNTDWDKASRGELLIENYTSTTKYKRFHLAMRTYQQAYTEYVTQDILGLYRSTSAITSVDIYRSLGSGTFSNASNTSVRIYGVS